MPPLSQGNAPDGRYGHATPTYDSQAMTRGDRPCIPPPAPRRLRKKYSTQLAAIPKPQPISKNWKQVEETAIDTIRPGKRSGMRFIVSNSETQQVIGEVEADNYQHAAVAAAAKFFGKESARRVNGWAGHPGVFDAFNLQEEEDTTPFHLRQL
jgi:hypothetical protein